MQRPPAEEHDAVCDQVSSQRPVGGEVLPEAERATFGRCLHAQEADVVAYRPAVSLGGVGIAMWRVSVHDLFVEGDAAAHCQHGGRSDRALTGGRGFGFVTVTVLSSGTQSVIAA
jgi:hypothetical protein